MNGGMTTANPTAVPCYLSQNHPLVLECYGRLTQNCSCDIDVAPAQIPHSRSLISKFALELFYFVPAQLFFSALLFANFSCHLLTFGGAFVSASCTINSIVSSIFEIVVIDGVGIKFAASSASVGNVEEGWRIMIGFDVFFCRIWYFLSAAQRMAYPGVVAVAGEEFMVILGIISLVNFRGKERLAEGHYLTLAEPRARGEVREA